MKIILDKLKYFFIASPPISENLPQNSVNFQQGNGILKNNCNATTATTVFSDLLSNKLARLGGMSAAFIGVYGYFKKIKYEQIDRRNAFESAYGLHVFHTVALYLTGYSAHPKTSAFFLTFGIVLFCCPQYLYAFDCIKKNEAHYVTPFGLLSFFLGWMAMVF